jgi:glycosyltransferase involved in cell wall biosynthesis
MVANPRPLLLLEGGDVHGNDAHLRYGGFIRFWDAALAELLEHGVRPTIVFTRDANPLMEVAQARGLDTFLLHCRTAGDYPRGGLRLARIIHDTDVNLIHANETIQAFLAALARPKIPVIFHRHHLKMEWRIRRLQSWAQRRATAIMAVSMAVANSAVQEGTPPKKVWVCHNGLPEPSLRRHESKNPRESLAISNSETIAMVVGHLRWEKGFDRFIRAVSDVNDKGHSLRGIIVGDGPELSALRNLSRSLANKVDLVGHQEDVFPWIRLADIIVLPSRHETFGLVAVEALSQGKAILATRVGGLPEVITTQCGLLVESNHASLVEGLIQLVQGDGLRSRLATAGKARYKSNFTSALMVNRWMLCYRAVLRQCR